MAAKKGINIEQHKILLATLNAGIPVRLNDAIACGMVSVGEVVAKQMIDQGLLKAKRVGDAYFLLPRGETMDDMATRIAASMG